VRSRKGTQADLLGLVILVFIDVDVVSLEFLPVLRVGEAIGMSNISYTRSREARLTCSTTVEDEDEDSVFHFEHKTEPTKWAERGK
jgi:hypothetical protein